MTCLSPSISRPTDVTAEPPDSSAPQASPEVSDVELQSTPRRPVVPPAGPGGLLRVPSMSNTWNDNTNEV